MPIRRGALLCALLMACTPGQSLVARPTNLAGTDGTTLPAPEQAVRWLSDGRYPEALSYFETRWRERTPSHGSRDPETLLAQFYCGQTLMLMGRPVEALDRLGPASTALEEVLGASHKWALIARANFAIALRETGSLKQSGRLLKAVLERIRSDHPPELISQTQMELATSQAYLGHTRPAMRNAKEALRRIPDLTDLRVFLLIGASQIALVDGRVSEAD